MNRAQEIIEDFQFFDNWEEKDEYIIDMGKNLSPMDDALKNNATKVDGCMSQVWLNATYTDDIVNFQADSDAIIVRGLIALICGVVQGQPKSEIVAFNFLDFFNELGLDRQLSPNRRNGLVAFVALMQQKLQ